MGIFDYYKTVEAPKYFTSFESSETPIISSYPELKIPQLELSEITLPSSNNKSSTKLTLSDIYGTTSKVSTKSFEEALKESGLDKEFKITSGYRDHNVGKAGNKSNHRHKDENGNSYAYDIVPIDGNFKTAALRIKNNPIMHEWLKSKGARFIDESTKEALAKTGGTGAHFHFSFNPNSKEGIAWSQKGGILKAGTYFTSFESSDDPVINSPIMPTIKKPMWQLDETNYNEPITKQTLSDIYSIPYKNTNVEYNKEGIVKYFTDKGLTRNLALGIYGNLKQESSLRSDASHGDLYGLALWRGDRLKNLKSKYGDTPTLELQLDFIWKELNTTEKSALEKLKATNSIKEATASFMHHYERPNSKYARLDLRLKYANE